jgi:hypothetical protein
MRNQLVVAVLSLCVPWIARSQVLEFASLNTRQIEKLDRAKTVVLYPAEFLKNMARIFPQVLTGYSTSNWPTTWRLLSPADRDGRP